MQNAPDRAHTRFVFVTGTDTNVGKTVVTALLTAHLSAMGMSFRAVKPFCSGERTDALLLAELQHGMLSIDQLNPFYFPPPVSPWTAARLTGRTISATETLEFLHERARGMHLLLIEGAGGLLSPLADKLNSADLIATLGAEVIVVAANRLGVLNHTLLTVEALRARGVKQVRIALVDPAMRAEAVRSNESDLRILLPDILTVRIPFLAAYSPNASVIRNAATEARATLDELIR